MIDVEVKVVASAVVVVITSNRVPLKYAADVPVDGDFVDVVPVDTVVCAEDPVVPVDDEDIDCEVDAVVDSDPEDVEGYGDEVDKDDWADCVVADTKQTE